MTNSEPNPVPHFVGELGVVTSEFVPPPPSTIVADCSVIDGFSYGKFETELCYGCGGYIFDRYLLNVNNQPWHMQCLRCNLCGLDLEQFPSCHVKDERAYCKQCYTRQFGVKCTRCGRIIQPTDWVRRARQFVYHLACFACDACKRQLSTGEEFALQDCRVLCKQHYMELLDGDSGKGHQKQKTKRVRTTFGEEQLQVLTANFQIDSNPDGQDLERIAQITGLSKRVTQVWFQNSRARQKKYQGLKGRQQSHSQGQTTSTSGDENDMCQIPDDQTMMDSDEGLSLSPCRSVSDTLASCDLVDAEPYCDH